MLPGTARIAENVSAKFPAACLFTSHVGYSFKHFKIHDSPGESSPGIFFISTRPGIRGYLAGVPGFINSQGTGEEGLIGFRQPLLCHMLLAPDAIFGPSGNNVHWKEIKGIGAALQAVTAPAYAGGGFCLAVGAT